MIKFVLLSKGQLFFEAKLYFLNSYNGQYKNLYTSTSDQRSVVLVFCRIYPTLVLYG